MMSKQTAPSLSLLMISSSPLLPPFLAQDNNISLGSVFRGQVTLRGLYREHSVDWSYLQLRASNLCVSNPGT